MRVLLFLLLSLSLLCSASLEKRIQLSKQKLKKVEKKYKGVHSKLIKIAKEIASAKKELKQIDKKIALLNANIAKATKNYHVKLKEYNETIKNVDLLTNREITLKQKLNLLIAKKFSKSLLLSSIKQQTPESIYQEEVLKALEKRADIQMKALAKQFLQTKSVLTKKLQKLQKLQKELKNLLDEKEKLKELKKRKKEEVKKLLANKHRYDRFLQKLIDEQRSLNKTLQRLSLLKEKRQTSSSSPKINIKKYGQNSYKSFKTIKYRGPKTIPPLTKFVITKKYGIYKDPIYNIEIPNENIELKPLIPNEKVRNVLNGEIILAKWTPHLKNVVVVKHSNRLYTIYANLDKLAPYIKKGRRIKKGSIIGRVNSKLIFEVTKNNRHINPLDLIKVK